MTAGTGARVYQLRVELRRARLKLATSARARLWGRGKNGLRFGGFALPSRLVPPPPGQRRIEIGSGRYPTDGYVHVDTDARAPHLELLSRADTIPLPDGWADEILAVHVIEHVPASSLPGTLRHWHDLLAPGGQLEVHTPDAVAIGRLLADDSLARPTFWAVQNGAFGYDRHPADATGPEQLTAISEHRVLLSRPVLIDLLRDAGFCDIEDVDATRACRHQLAWSDHVPGFCLELTAHRPASAGAAPRLTG